MNKNKYNNMFKVSHQKRNFLDNKTGILTNNSFHEKCKFDIHDEATYDMNGNFIEYGEQTLYNTCFLILLSDLNIFEVKDFFNYHYDYTPNKETYLDYLEFGILNDKSIYLGIKELCKKLIDEKRKPIQGGLTNWDLTKRYYFAYLENVNFHIDNINKIHEFSDNLVFDLEIHNVCHRANNEIEHLSISNTYNLKSINNELNVLINRINEIVDLHKLTHVNNYPNYQCFFETVQHLFNLFDWFNNNIESSIIKKTRIAVKLSGCGAENLNIKTQPVYHYIKDVLDNYNLKPFEAIDILNDTRGAFSPHFNMIVVNGIISYLETLHKVKKELIEPQQSVKEPESIKDKQPTLKQLALYHVYLGTKMNNDNANGFLKDTTHTTGNKLKQHFDHYYLPKNRIYGGTDRPNFRRKLFAKVILMLKETGNKDAISEAETELIQFEKNIE